MATDRVLVDASALERTVAAILHVRGFGEQDAARSARVLVSADLRGVESHGVSNMLRRYLEWIDSGHLNPVPQVSVIHQKACVASYDADGGLGLAVLPVLMQETIERARQYGIAMVGVRNARHSGMLAFHTILASEQDMVGVCATSGGPRVIPTFGREPRLGTNPLSVALPSNDDHPFVFDAATSVVAYNKIANARRGGDVLGAGWCADGSGTPMMDQRPSDLDVDERMLPLGSSPELGSHKGYALSAVVDVLASILPNGTFIGNLGHGYNGHFLMAINPAGFGPLEEFKSQVSEFARYLRATPRADRDVAVLVPNDREWTMMCERQRSGIPVHREVIAWFDTISDEYGVQRLSR